MTFTILPKIKIHYLMIALIIICSFSGFLGQILLISFTILLHEMGHLFFIILFGGKIKSMTLNIFGGRLDANTSKIKKRWKKILVDMGRNYYKYFKNNDKIDFIIRFNWLMIVFNLLPIFPLDGYRFIEDVCILNKKILIKEIFIYGGILILLFVMISTFIMGYYGIIAICIYLIYLNILKLLQNKRLEKQYYYQMMYEMTHFCLK